MKMKRKKDLTRLKRGEVSVTFYTNDCFHRKGKHGERSRKLAGVMMEGKMIDGEGVWLTRYAPRFAANAAPRLD